MHVFYQKSGRGTSGGIFCADRVYYVYPNFKEGTAILEQENRVQDAGGGNVKAEIKALQRELAALQQRIKEAGLPVVVLLSLIHI